MKGRIGKYKDKIVVWGDPNLTAKNEINIDSLGGGQADIPVEYYKVVAPEGEDLNKIRREIFFLMVSIAEYYGVSSFHILVKGTSSTNTHRLFTGLTLLTAITLENTSFHAYSIRAFHTITKVVDGDGIITEVPSFNNIFDAFDLTQPGIPLQFKQLLVPITAEEFYNLDDMK